MLESVFGRKIALLSLLRAEKGSSKAVVPEDPQAAAESEARSAAALREFRVNEPIFVPTRATLEQRLGAQRSRILNAHGIAKLCASAAWQDEADAMALRSSLEGLCELLETVRRDMGALLKPESAPEG